MTLRAPVHGDGDSILWWARYTVRTWPEDTIKRFDYVMQQRGIDPTNIRLTHEPDGRWAVQITQPGAAGPKVTVIP